MLQENEIVKCKIRIRDLEKAKVDADILNAKKIEEVKEEYKNHIKNLKNNVKSL
jgi:phage host-nuclease inhibitor protein Gam